MKIKECFEILNKIYPISSQEIWDKSGLCDYANILESEIKNPILSLDINLNVIEFAIKNKANLIISHHPIFIDEIDLKKQHIKTIINLLKNHKIALISLHTCFDKHKYGTSYQIIKILKGFKIFRSKKSQFIFFGISKSKISVNQLLIKIKKNLNLNYLEINKPDLIKDYNDKKFLKIAVVGGAGSSEIELILKKDKIDFFITSEIKWHMWNHSYYFNLIQISHEVEKVFINTIENKLKNSLSFLKFYPNSLITF